MANHTADFIIVQTLVYKQQYVSATYVLPRLGASIQCKLMFYFVFQPQVHVCTVKQVNDAKLILNTMYFMKY